MKNKFQLLLALFIFLGNVLTDAQIKLSKNFIQKMETVGAEFLEPLENSYRKMEVRKNTIYNYDFAIKGKKEDLEVRFDVRPEFKNNFPHIQSITISSTVATNDDDALVALHEMPQKELEKYHADWGATFFFQPKFEFSSKKHCKMISLYKEGKGMITMFFLFDKPSEEVDLQKYCLMFLEETQGEDN